MTSAKKLAANRRNSRRSKGPVTVDGKRRASRNAMRHGLSSAIHRTVILSKEAEQMVKAICDGNVDPLVVEQATIIAESALTLCIIRDQKAAVVERLYDPLLVALAKGDKRAASADIISRQTRIADREMSQLIGKLEKQGTEFYAQFQPAPLDPNEPACRYEPLQPRSQHEALCEALPDLERLVRYERRAMSRQKKAIHRLVAIKLMNRQGSSAPVIAPQ